MPASEFLQNLRAKLGNDLLVMPAVSIRLLDDTGRLLLMHYRNTRKWGLPGGYIEPHEQPAATAVREMWEETGLHVELDGIIGVGGGPEHHLVYPNGDQVSVVSIFFSARAVGGHLHARDGEAMGLAYCTQPEAAERDLTPWMQTWLSQLYDPTPSPFYTPNTWSPESE